ncbi:glutathione S-transferase family protein [Burkholderia sp. 22PA0106]|uniref:glutathione S-transferase family protein n=1 Tax=Burkholderia sp. 22PA0106 TaxID=3237371 RepID=UPI0039C2BA44
MSSAARPAAPIRLYRAPLSGHAHRAQLMLSLLDLPHELIDVNLAEGEQHSAAFLALNPFAQVPVIVDGDVVLADSTAILVYLAKRYGDASWLPDDPAGAAAVQHWLALASGPIMYGPCAARLATLFNAPFDHAKAVGTAEKLLVTLDKELAGRRFALGETRTIADVAGYSYIAHAPEGGVSLAPYPNVRAWLERVEALPGFVGMRKSPALA